MTETTHWWLRYARATADGGWELNMPGSTAAYTLMSDPYIHHWRPGMDEEQEKARDYPLCYGPRALDRIVRTYLAEQHNEHRGVDDKSPRA